MIDQGTPEWFEARKGRVTASMAGAILGIAIYMTRADAMRSMVRAAIGEPTEFEGNIATRYGSHHEAGAVVEFQIETGLTVTPAPFVPFEDWAGASPDAYVSDGGLLEVKCPFGLRKQERPIFKSAAQQPHYLAQMQMQMICTDAPHCWFYQWAPHGTRIEKVLRDPDWPHMSALRQFHAEFLSEVTDNADHYRGSRVPEIDTDEARSMVATWDWLNEHIDGLIDTRRKLLESFVSMSGSKSAVISGRKLTLTERKGAVAYAQAVKRLMPDADLEPYRGKATTYWRLT